MSWARHVNKWNPEAYGDWNNLKRCGKVFQNSTVIRIADCVYQPNKIEKLEVFEKYETMNIVKSGYEERLVCRKLLPIFLVFQR